MSDFNFESNDPTQAVDDQFDSLIATEESVQEFENAVEVVVEAPVVEAVFEAPVAENPIVDYKHEENLSNNKTSVLYAIKDLKILGLGSLQKGYNTVSVNEVDRWLEKASVRIASEEEIKTYHNK